MQTNTGHLERNNQLNTIVSRAQEYINKGNLKEAVISIASDIKDDPTLDDMQKGLIVQLSMDYKDKPDLSRQDVDTFIEYVGRFFE